MKGPRVKSAVLTSRNSSTFRRGQGRPHQESNRLSEGRPVTRNSVKNRKEDPVRRIEQSIAYMMQHVDEPLPVRKLAAQASVSPSHYFALFRRQTGSSPIDYFIRLRMREACHLLGTTVMSVKEIAASLGYEDPFYFSRRFKSVNHVAPSEYRMLPKELKDGIKRAALPRNSSARIGHRKNPGQAEFGRRTGGPARE